MRRNNLCRKREVQPKSLSALPHVSAHFGPAHLYRDKLARFPNPGIASNPTWTLDVAETECGEAIGGWVAAPHKR